MSKRVYNTRLHFGTETQWLLDQVVETVEEYEEMGFVMTLRQVYYQLVRKALIPNDKHEYNRLKDVVRRGRLAGYIDWDSIEDRTRFLRDVSSWENPEGVLSSAVDSFKRDPWQDQKVMLEVWIEKDALIGNIEGKCEELRIPHFSCRGYTSLSEMWRAAQRIGRRMIRRKQPTLILHLGDHDPSGIDMTRDIGERLTMFMRKDLKFRSGHEFTQPVIRLALNMDQVEEHEPPPNPAKLTDARARKYIREYGEESWELDALGPATLNGLIQDYWDEVVDKKIWDKNMKKEAADRKKLERFTKTYGKKETPKCKKKVVKKKTKKK